jgi:hypothetical protein|tara:strand:- start:70 stop:315 length:246 start_codon:yes stop_codon:yes gene_type:complete
MIEIWYLFIEVIKNLFFFIFVGLTVFMPGALIAYLIFGEFGNETFDSKPEAHRYMALIFLLFLLGLYIYNQSWLTKSELYL